MTRKDIDNIISIICPNDEDFEKPIISPAYLKNELEALALEQEPCTDAISRQAVLDMMQMRMGAKELYKAVYHLPPVTPAKKERQWEWNQYDGNPKIGNWHCSECLGIGKSYYDYCPSCGTKMSASPTGAEREA